MLASTLFQTEGSEDQTISNSQSRLYKRRNLPLVFAPMGRRGKDKRKNGRAETSFNYEFLAGTRLWQVAREQAIIELFV